MSKYGLKYALEGRVKGYLRGSFICSKCTGQMVVSGSGATRNIHNYTNRTQVEMDKTLQAFPEYSTALVAYRSGRFSEAIPIFERMHDVMASALGSDSPIAGELIFQTANMYQQSGDHKAAVNLLQTNLLEDHNSRVSLIRNCRYHQLSSKCHLLIGDAAQAQQAAEKAVQICEETNIDSGDGDGDEDLLPLFSSSYSMLGISTAYQIQEWENAETYLQLAARWAHHPDSTDSFSDSNSDDIGYRLDSIAVSYAQSITALSNLGSFCLFRLADGAGVGASEMLPVLRRQTSITAGAIERSWLLEKALVVEAIAYYEDAVQVATSASASASSSSGSAGSAAAAMCGVSSSSSSSSSSNTAVGMTGMMPADEVRLNPTAPAPPSATPPVSEVTIEIFLQRLPFLQAYVSVLCNLAELYELVGDISKKQEYISSALAAMQIYTDAMQAIDSSGPPQPGNGTRSSVAHLPLLGRVLSLAAFQELSKGQAVAAEGLYNTALGHLTSPYALHQPDSQFEKAMLLGGLGTLLSQWEKRDIAGKNYLQQSEQLLLQQLGWPAAAVSAHDGMGQLLFDLMLEEQAVVGCFNHGLDLPFTSLLLFPVIR